MSQTIHDPLKNYITVIQDLTAVAGDITHVEEIKTAAAADKRHELLDGCIQEEQALLLKLRGLEQHRISLQKDLGWDTLTLQQILDRSSEEERELLSPVFARLDHYLRRLQQAREAAEKILKVRLHELEVFSQMGASYDNSGNVNPPGTPQGGGRIRSTYV